MKVFSIPGTHKYSTNGKYYYVYIYFIIICESLSCSTEVAAQIFAEQIMSKMRDENQRLAPLVYYTFIFLCESQGLLWRLETCF